MSAVAVGMWGSVGSSMACWHTTCQVADCTASVAVALTAAAVVPLALHMLPAMAVVLTHVALSHDSLAPGYYLVAT